MVYYLYDYVNGPQPTRYLSSVRLFFKLGIDKACPG
jgi:hypothetical protein